MASRNRTQAEAIYQQQQAARTAAERIGCPVTSLMLATVDEIEAHLDLVDRLARERGLSNPGDLRYWGRGENEIAYRGRTFEVTVLPVDDDGGNLYTAEIVERFPHLAQAASWEGTTDLVFDSPAAALAAALAAIGETVDDDIQEGRGPRER